MIRFLLKNFLLIGIVVGGCTGLLWPGPGSVLKDTGLVPVLIGVIFVCSGLQMQTGSFRKELRNARALVFALVSVNVTFPLVALVLAKSLSIEGDAFIGLLVIATAPPTLASGIIITTLAGGSTALAILLTIAGNISAVILMPVGLGLALSLTTSIDLPVLSMLSKLFYLIVLPTFVGQLLRAFGADLADRYRGVISFVPSVAIVIIVFMLVSSGSARIREQATDLTVVAVASVALHMVMLGVNRLGAGALRLDLAASKALTIVASQKTLPVSAFVVAQAFGDRPAAIVPCIVFHILQILLDTVVAHRWSQRSERT